jgi:hypothetical protein
MNNFNDTIGNRTLDLPACSSVPQSTVPSRDPVWLSNPGKAKNILSAPKYPGLFSSQPPTKMGTVVR